MRLDAGNLATLHSVGGDAFVRQIVSLFLNDAPERAERMKCAVAAGDGAAIERAAHSIRGSCGAFGANDLTNLCREVECLVRDGRVAEAGAQVDTIVREVQEVCTALSAHVGLGSDASPIENASTRVDPLS